MLFLLRVENKTAVEHIDVILTAAVPERQRQVTFTFVFLSLNLAHKHIQVCLHNMSFASN